VAIVLKDSEGVLRGSKHFSLDASPKGVSRPEIRGGGS
jgi:hypothetical protein